jgi:hypothetical protein
VIELRKRLILAPQPPTVINTALMVTSLHRRDLVLGRFLSRSSRQDLFEKDRTVSTRIL